MNELKRTTFLNSGDEALVTALTLITRVAAQHMDDGEDFIEDLRRNYRLLAQHTHEGAVARNVYTALAQQLPVPAAAPD